MKRSSAVLHGSMPFHSSLFPVELGDPIELGRELFAGAALGTAQVSLGAAEDPALERVGPLAEPGRVLSGVELGPLFVVPQMLKS